MGRRSTGMPFAAVALLGAVVATAVGGCQSEETPPASPTPSATVSSPSPSASASVSPSPSPSGDVPAEAREKTDEGAEAFVTYFFDQVNRAWTTPEAGVIAALSVKGCEFCEKTEATALYLVKEHQRYESNPVSVTQTARFAGAPRDQHYYSIQLTQNRSRILDASGAVVATDPKKETQFNVAVQWAENGWRMLGVENAE